MHALMTAAFLLAGAAVVTLIWWEFHRHRTQIARVLMDPPRVDRTAAQRRAELLESAATVLLVAAFVAVLVLI
jgi:hypothetical protein